MLCIAFAIGSVLDRCSCRLTGTFHRLRLRFRFCSVLCVMKRFREQDAEEEPDAEEEDHEIKAAFIQAGCGTSQA